MTASTLLGMLLPATLASCASALALVLSSGAPARWRLAIASSGLLAWLIPWPLLVLPMTSPQAAIAADWGGNFAEELVVGPVHPTTSVASAGHADGSTRALAWLPVALPAMALLPGLLMLLADIVRYRRTLAEWRRDSMSGEHLRILLPAAVRKVPYAIRIVPRSRIAAATGLGRGTIWVGDALAGHAHLNAALLHECLHIDRKDTIAILTATLIKRIYFWNPIVRYFADRAELFIEAACDEGCARLLGRVRYRTSLARLILDSHSARMAFASMVRTGRHDVLRVAALTHAPRVHTRACLGAALGAIGLGLAATLNAQAGADPRIGAWDELRTLGSWDVIGSRAQYQSVLRTFETRDNGMIRMVLNAKLIEANRWHVDFRCDGGKYRVLTQDGRFTGYSNSCRRTGPRTFETRVTREEGDPTVDLRWTPQGSTSTTGTETVSADGETYTMVSVERLADGQTLESRREFVRRHESTVFLGVNALVRNVIVQRGDASALRGVFEDLRAGRPAAARWGAILSVAYHGVSTRGWDTYEARHENGGVSTWHVLISSDGKIEGATVEFSPGP